MNIPHEPMTWNKLLCPRKEAQVFVRIPLIICFEIYSFSISVVKETHDSCEKGRMRTYLFSIIVFFIVLSILPQLEKSFRFCWQLAMTHTRTQYSNRTRTMITIDHYFNSNAIFESSSSLTNHLWASSGSFSNFMLNELIVFNSLTHYHVAVCQYTQFLMSIPRNLLIIQLVICKIGKPESWVRNVILTWNVRSRCDSEEIGWKKWTESGFHLFNLSWIWLVFTLNGLNDECKRKIEHSSKSRKRCKFQASRMVFKEFKLNW